MLFNSSVYISRHPVRLADKNCDVSVLYFEFFLNLLAAKLIKKEQFEITGKKSNFVEKYDQSCESSTKMHCTLFCGVCDRGSSPLVF